MTDRLQLFEATDYFSPFPQPKDVFGVDVELHSEYLLPLATLHLSHVVPAENAVVHFVQAMEPLKKWIVLQYDNNRCKLTTDFSFFRLAELKAKRRLTQKQEIERAELQELYAKMRNGYQLRKQHFLDHGVLHHPWARERKGVYQDSDRVSLVDRLGGDCYSGNWSAAHKYEIAGRRISRGVTPEGDRTATPQTDDGRDFMFVGELKTFTYIAESPAHTSVLDCVLLLFYDPVSDISLTMMDFS